MKGVLLQVLQVILLGVGLDLVDSLHCLPLDVGVLAPNLDVGHLDSLQVLVLEVDDELVNC